MSVSVDLIGRLGNNLFQIAAAIGYGQKHGVEVFIPDWEYKNCFRTNFTRHATGSTNVGEEGFGYKQLPFVQDCKLMGYFQSEKYFLNAEGKVRELFCFNDQIQANMNTKYQSLMHGGSVNCSIHVRRGDYIGNNFHEVCHLDYYKDAISEMKRRVNIDMFVIFSDDIEWCKQNLQAENCVFMEGNSNVEDLYFMTQCNHHIICNSSFSWWGSWLNNKEGKTVIAPGKWFGDQSYDTKDILPESWIKINI